MPKGSSVTERARLQCLSASPYTVLWSSYSQAKVHLSPFSLGEATSSPSPYSSQPWARPILPTFCNLLLELDFGLVFE